MENLSNLFDTLNVKEKLNLIKSSRNKKDGTPSWLLIDDNIFEYKTSYEAKDGKITWRCNNTKFPNCTGAVFTIGYYKPITLVQEHEHCATIKTEVKAVKAKIKEMACSQPDSTARKIILECQKESAKK